MSLRDLVELTFSRDGNNGPVANWRRAVSNAVDTIINGGAGGLNTFLYFSRAAVPSSESPGVVMDAGPQPGGDVPVASLLIPPGTWSIRAASVGNMTPDGDGDGSYQIFNVTTGNPLGSATLDTGSATPANFTLTEAAATITGPAILQVNIGGSVTEAAVSAPQVVIVLEAVPG